LAVARFYGFPLLWEGVWMFDIVDRNCR
jgi:hypothetical protein